MAKKKQDNTLPVLTHILAYFTSLIGPLIILLAAESKHAKNHARAALNWQLSLIVYILGAIIFIIIFALTIVLIPFAFILAIGILVLGILDIVFVIIAAVKASEGTLWQYPITIPFAKIEQ